MQTETIGKREWVSTVPSASDQKKKKKRATFHSALLKKKKRGSPKKVFNLGLDKEERKYVFEVTKSYKGESSVEIGKKKKKKPGRGASFPCPKKERGKTKGFSPFIAPAEKKKGGGKKPTKGEARLLDKGGGKREITWPMKEGGKRTAPITLEQGGGAIHSPPEKRGERRGLQSPIPKKGEKRKGKSLRNRRGGERTKREKRFVLRTDGSFNKRDRFDTLFRGEKKEPKCFC